MTVAHGGFLVKTTNGVAVAGLAFPVWWPSLETISATAGALVPVLSATWLTIQIVRFVWQWRRGHGE